MWTRIFLFLWIIGTVKHKLTPLSHECAKHVQRCPTEKDQWEQKNIQLECASHDGYVCLRDSDGYLVESCMPNFTVHANSSNCPTLVACLNKDGNNKPYLGTAKTFYHCPVEVSGCPPRNHTEYSIHQLYKYPKCLESNFSSKIKNTSPRSSTSMATIRIGHDIKQDNKYFIVIVTVLLLAVAGCFVGYLVYSRKKTQGLSCLKIKCKLEDQHSFRTTRQNIWRFLKRKDHEDQGKKLGLPESDPRVVVTKLHRAAIGEWINENREVTAAEISMKLRDVFNISVSDGLISSIRRSMGWTSKNVSYCQLISNKNKEVRLQWCTRALSETETFSDVIFVDVTTVEMCSSGRLYFYKPSSGLEKLPCRLPKPKHSYKVHVWGGISYRGRTDICVFTGIMDSIIYQQILERNFLPYVSEVFPEGYRLYQDNDSKHKSKSTKQWMVNVGMLQNVMDTPASSPDINPIENVWGSMKYYLQTNVKPKKKEELIQGIKEFWNSLTVEKCTNYVNHIHKVLPYVILNGGGPSGF